METVEQPTESEDRIWVPYEELKKYLESLGATLRQMSDSIEMSLGMIEENARSLNDNKGDN